MKINFICFICLLPLVSFSQITIQQSALPAVGNAWTLFSDTIPFPAINISPPGPAQTWDYTTGFNNVQPNIIRIIDPSTLNGYSLFPNSNIARQDNSSNNIFNIFLNNDSSGLYIEGTYTYDTLGYITKVFYTNFNTLHVPFTYNNNFTDTFKEESITIFSPSTPQPAEKHITTRFQNNYCDAWGTLKTPCNQIPIDVIRVRTLDLGAIDSMFLDNTGTGSGTWTLNSIYTFINSSGYADWYFYQNNSPVIAMEIYADSNNLVISAGYACDTILSGINTNEVASSLNNIFPCPVKGEFVQIRIPNASIKNIAIYNLSGSLVKELQASGISTINLSTDYFQNGIYFCVYFDGEKKKVYSEKFVVNK